MDTRNVALDLIRGLCAVGVAAYHYAAWNGLDPDPSIGAFLVYTFFVLSGLTMMMVHGRDFSGAISAEALKDFYGKRIARIIPLLALCATYSIGQNVDHWARAVLTGTGLFALGAPDFLSTVPGAWSLGIELCFYLLFPTAVVLLTPLSTRGFVIVIAAAIVAQQIAIAAVAGLAKWGALYTTPLTFIPFFLLGMLAERDQSALAGWRCAVSLACLSGMVVLAGTLPADVDAFRSPPVYLALLALSFAAVWSAYRAWIPEVLKRPSIFLGEISYALYLTHPLAFKVATKAANLVGMPALKPIIAAALAIGLARVINVTVERTSRQLLVRYLVSPGRPVPSSTTGLSSP